MTDDIQDKHMALVEAPWTWRKELRQTDLPASAFRVGLALVDEFLNTKTGALFPSFLAIAEACDLPAETVRKGVKALKSAGLIATKKTKFNGSLCFLLSLPDALRNGQHGPVQDDGETVNMDCTNRAKLTAPNGQNSPDETVNMDHLTLEYNLRSEPPNITLAPASGPADDALRASPLRSVNSSLWSESSASVVDQPSTQNAHASPKDAEMEADDTPIPMPATYELQSKFIHEITGKRNATAMQAILDAWAMDKLITKRKAREIFEKCERERIAS
ncbi:hypothetical protein MOV66_07735 [Agrobacterium sp. SHOUNA12C]|nr:hypothetical protein [Agrobacterium sp. BETTINA12B]MCJ9756531.1 hypothetical protein [Agrobacterium sp. SHOUNA12C]